MKVEKELTGKIYQSARKIIGSGNAYIGRYINLPCKYVDLEKEVKVVRKSNGEELIKDLHWRINKCNAEEGEIKILTSYIGREGDELVITCYCEETSYEIFSEKFKMPIKKELSENIARMEAIGILDLIPDNVYWEDLVNEYYGFTSNAIPSIYDIFIAFGISKNEYIMATGKTNINWPIQTIVIQVDGKVCSRLQIAADIGEEDIKQKALADEKVASLIADKAVKKIIVVKGKLVNIILA